MTLIFILSIAGLALKSSNNPNGADDLLFNHFRTSGILDSSIFCYWINEEATEAELIFGGVDYSRINSDIVYFDVGFWF
jgi:hypothetical protein